MKRLFVRISDFRCWILLIALCSICQPTKAGQSEKAMEAETANYRVSLTACVAGVDPATGIPTRECTIEVTDIESGGQRSVFFGKGYLGRSETFTDVQIFDDTLVILTDATIIAFDLKRDKVTKLIAAMSANFLPGRNLVLFNELELRRMPPEMTGRVLSVFDVSTLRRRSIFPEKDKLTELPVPGYPIPGLKFEPFLRPKKKDSACSSYKNYWSSDNSKLAFSCDYDLVEDGSSLEVGTDVIIVSFPPEVSEFTLKRIKLYNRLYRKSVEIDPRESKVPINELRWLSDDVLEIVTKPRDWLHSGATLNVITDELLVRD